MKGCLRYNGDIPVFALKREWSKGKEVSVQELFEKFGSRCSATDSLNMQFVEWFYTSYVKNMSDDFEFVIDTESTSVDEVVTEDNVTESSTNMLNIESSSVNVGSSQEEVISKLKSMRHPDVVGHIEREAVIVQTNKTKSEEVKSIPKPFTSVLTGDDLEASRKRPPNKPTTLIMNDEGKAVPSMPTTKEMEAKKNSRMASISKNSIILEETDLVGGTSRVVVGGTIDQESTAPQSSVDKKPAKSVNSNFAAYPTDGVRRELSPDDIARNPDESEAIKLINGCKDKVILRVAKIYCHEIGKQKLVEKLEQRLRQLPPF